jgi:hypothetical protein
LLCFLTLTVTGHRSPDPEKISASVGDEEKERKKEYEQKLPVHSLII